MTEELASRIVDAYKASPLLTALVILLVGMAVGFGWWEHKRIAETNAFVQQQLAKQDALQDRLLQLAKHCPGGVQ